MGFAHLLYLLAATFNFGIGMLFFLSKDGIERKLLIWLFWTVSFGLFLRGFVILIPLDVLEFYKDVIPTLIVTPLTIVSGVTLFVLFKKYIKK